MTKFIRTGLFTSSQASRWRQDTPLNVDAGVVSGVPFAQSESSCHPGGPILDEGTHSTRMWLAAGEEGMSTRSAAELKGGA